MHLSGIYAITDEHLLNQSRLSEAAAAALEHGVSVIQYRNKLGDDRQRRDQARRLLELCKSWSVPLLINDDVELCAAIGADGVHLGQNDCSLGRARELLGVEAIIGITCHQSLDLARAAARGGADYVAFGRFYASTTKPQAPAADPDIIGRAKSVLDIPVVAIGGINAENGASLVAAGADMLAVAGGLFGNPNIAENAHKLVSLYHQ